MAFSADRGSFSSASSAAIHSSAAVTIRYPEARLQAPYAEQGGNQILPIGRPRRKRSTLFVVPALAILLLAAAGCASVSNPDGWAGPALDDDTLFVTPDNGEIAAVDVEDFTARWLFPAADEVVCGDSPQARERDLRGIYGKPVHDEQNVYIGGYDGYVYSLSREDGDCNWAFDTGDPIVGGLAIAEGTLYFGSDNGYVYALDSTDGGTAIDPFYTGESIWVTPLVEDGVVYVSNVGGDVFALDAQTFDPVWDGPFSVDGGLLTNPVLADDDTLIVGGIGGSLHAINIATGAEEWSFGAGNWFWAEPLVEDGVIYAPNLDGSVYALNADGTAAWPAPFEAEHAIRSSPLLVDGDAETEATLLVVDRRGNVYGVDPAEGTSLWPAPAVVGDDVLADPVLLEDETVLIVAKGGDLFQINSDGGGLRRIELAI